MATPDGTADSPRADVPTRRRKLLVWGLVAVASVLAFVAIATTWVDRQLLDNNNWENASRDVAADPAVRSAVAAYLVNQLYDNVDVAAGLEQRLPPQTKQLAAPLAAALREPVTRSAEFLLARPRVQELWIRSSTTAHEKLVNVLENKTGHGISTGEGVVTLDLRSLVIEIGTQLGLSGDRLQQLPADTGNIVLLRSDQLSAAQTAVRAAKAASALLLVLVFGLYALAIYLARGARRHALRSVG